jgi:hypothetical protein
MSEVPPQQATRVVLDRNGGPPALEGQTALNAYLLMLLQQAINARNAIPPYDEAVIQADKRVFRAHHAAKDRFWLRYGAAAGAVDVSMATRQIESGVYEKMRGKLNELLLSATSISL